MYRMTGHYPMASSDGPSLGKGVTCAARDRRQEGAHINQFRAARTAMSNDRDRRHIGGYAPGYYELFASLAAWLIPLRPAGRSASRIFMHQRSCRERTHLPRTGSWPRARHETLAMLT